ncbi:hypothetical protein E2C01_044382 [Portunus trituberculatus]|uniref:Uncharacterized protein n=1 Tax=Portunus trituberculatus TaxID=210409 RepID=A0A5B7FZV9_PORTR|nr:hypothetical protein [Portunus trituberculatus]
MMRQFPRVCAICRVWRRRGVLQGIVPFYAGVAFPRDHVPGQAATCVAPQAARRSAVCALRREGGLS